MDTKKLGPMLGVVVVLVIVVLALQGGDKSSDPQASPSPTASPLATISASPTMTPKPAVTPKPATLPTSYGDAVAQFADRRMQFDMYCQAKPLNATYKNGTQIMLDNRSGDARIVVVNGVQHSLAGYGWKIITLSSKTVPATWAVDCGAARNVSKILIQ